jgi:hypothetical protein
MRCVICQREAERLVFHHLEPGKLRRRTKEGIRVCHQCGDQVHLMFTNWELRTQYNALEKLLASPRLQRYIEWVKDRPVEARYTLKRKKRRL